MCQMRYFFTSRKAFHDSRNLLALQLMPFPRAEVITKCFGLQERKRNLLLSGSASVQIEVVTVLAMDSLQAPGGRGHIYVVSCGICRIDPGFNSWVFTSRDKHICPHRDFYSSVHGSSVARNQSKHPLTRE